MFGAVAKRWISWRAGWEGGCGVRGSGRCVQRLRQPARPRTCVRCRAMTDPPAPTPRLGKYPILNQTHTNVQYAINVSINRWPGPHFSCMCDQRDVKIGSLFVSHCIASSRICLLYKARKITMWHCKPRTHTLWILLWTLCNIYQALISFYLSAEYE